MNYFTYHRDYTIYGGAINFAIYDDRIEIESDGKAPKEIADSNLKTVHRSIRRNPRIANVFFRRGLIEQWGRWISQIVDLCVAAGHPEPEIKETINAIKVCLFAKEPMRSQIIVSKENITQGMTILTKRQQEILSLLKAAKIGIPTRDIVAKLDSSKTTINRELEFLAKQGLVRKKGGGRAAVWTAC